MGFRADKADARAVVVVEGESDEVAVKTLAQRRGLDLAEAAVSVVRLGGAHRIGAFLEEFGLRTDGPRLGGLCDAGEEPVFRRALERASTDPCTLPRSRRPRANATGSRGRSGSMRCSPSRVVPGALPMASPAGFEPWTRVEIRRNHVGFRMLATR